MSAQDAFTHVPYEVQHLEPSDVPGELWMEIALDLDALDILALSQVHVHSQTSVRLWLIDLLGPTDVQVCARYSV